MEEEVGARRVWRPVRVVRRGGGGGGAGAGAASVGGMFVDSGTAVGGGGGGGEAAESALSTAFACSVERAAACSMPCTSRLFRNSQAASTRSGVSRLMTPMVRWIAPTGRMALAGRAGSPESLLGVVTSAAKRWREAWSCGREEVVTRGRRRKWVSWGFGLGGMVGGRRPWGLGKGRQGREVVVRG